MIETSGLALPKPLVKAFNWPEIRTRVTVDGVIAVVDAAAVRDGLFADEPGRGRRASARPIRRSTTRARSPSCSRSSSAAADLVVVNKADLLADGDWPAVERRVRAELRPGVRPGPRPPCRPADRRPARPRRGGRERPRGRGARTTTTAADHEHDDFLVLPPQRCRRSTTSTRFVARLEAAIARHPILRVKGFVAVAGKPMRLVLQGVGDRIQHYFDRAWRPSEAREGRLVVIGERDLDRSRVAAALAG